LGLLTASIVAFNRNFGIQLLVEYNFKFPDAVQDIF